jgi:hypothetical protein
MSRLARPGGSRAVELHQGPEQGYGLIDDDATAASSRIGPVGDDNFIIPL